MTNIPSSFDNQRLELRHVSPNDVKPAPYELRNYTRNERRRIKKAIKTFGPIALCVLADLTNLSGGVWLDCMKEAGLKEIPVIIMRHLTPALADLFMVAQVGLIERGTWDEKELGKLFLDLSMKNPQLDLDISGFDGPQIDLLIDKLSIEPVDDEATLEGLMAKAAGAPVTRTGDLWRLGHHHVLCADARDEAASEALIGQKLARMAICDLPYNVKIHGHVSGLGQITHREFDMASGEMTKAEFISFLVAIIKRMMEHCIDGALLFLFMDWRHMSELLVEAEACGLTLINLCVWAKTNAGMGSLYRSQHELVFVFRKGDGSHLNNVQLGKFGRHRSNLWTYAAGPGFGRAGDEGHLARLHPTVKPLQLIADAMLDVTQRGDVVIDYCLGSGTAVIAAEKVGRQAFGVEIDPIYVDVIIRRWQAWTGEAAIHAETGLTFDAVAAERLGGAHVI